MISAIVLVAYLTLASQDGDSISINVAKREMQIYDNGRLVSRYKVAVGSSRTPTPRGEFSVEEKLEDPYWCPGESIIRKLSEDFRKFFSRQRCMPPGPRNPMGKYAIRFADGYYIHTTPNESSIGKAVTLGCIRVPHEAGEYIFENIDKGAPVYME